MVVFEGEAPLLVPGDEDGFSDLFIWDGGSVTALGVPARWTGVPAFNADVTVTGSGAGHTVHVAFTTAERLVPEDANADRDVSVRTLGADFGMALASRPAGPGTPAVGGEGVTISGDGTRVA